MNLPAGVTPIDIDRLCQTDNSCPNRHDCIGCGREIQQDDDTRWWFFSEDFTDWKPTHRSDFTPAFETQEGWWCSADCFNECALEVEELPPTLFLVKGGRA